MKLMARGTEDVGGESTMYGLLALVSAIVAAGSFYCFKMYGGGMIALLLGVLFVFLMVAFGGVFLSAKVNKKEDIHITD